MKTTFIITFLLWCNIAVAQPETNLKTAIKNMETFFDESRNIPKGIESAQAVLTLAEANSKAYFEGMFYLGYWQIIALDDKAATRTLTDLQNALAKNEQRSLEVYWLYWHYLKSMYNSEISLNYEKALIHGMFGLSKATGHPKIMTLLAHQTAMVFGVIGQFDTGKTVLKVFKVGEQLKFKNSIEKGKFYIELGRAYKELEELEMARQTLKQAIDLLEPQKDNVPHLRNYAWHLYSLAFEDDTNYQIWEKLLEEGHRHYDYVGMLGSCYYRLEENYRKGLPFTQEALSQIIPKYRPKTLTDVPTLDMECKDIRALTSYAYHQGYMLREIAKDTLAAGDTSAAVQLLKSSIAAEEYCYEQYMTLVERMSGYQVGLWYANEEAVFTLGNVMRSVLSLYEITKSPTDLETFYHYMEKRKCLSIYQEILESPLPAALAQKIVTFRREMEALEVQFTMSPDKGYLDFFEDIMDLHLAFEAFEKELYQYPQTQITHNDIPFISIKNIQKTLGDDEAIVEYSLASWALLGIVITKNTVEAKLLRDAPNFEAIVYDYVNLIKNPFNIQIANRNTFIDKSNELYNLMIQPFETIIKDKKRLIIIPERQLLYLPYETLLKSTEKKPFHELHYLINDFEINYRYSASVHEIIKKRDTPKDFSTLTFAPIFENATATGSTGRELNLYRSSRYGILSDDAFVHLPFSKKEVTTIAQINGLDNTTELIGQEATKPNLINQINTKSYHFIHIATHSTMHFDDPRLSAIACYQSQGKGSLFFSYELARQSIHADMVVLSSCESGIGRIIDGEGLIGLNKTVLMSGAKNTIFSLWKVEDKHSCNLMIYFYEAYQQTNDYTKALHQAKLKMLQDSTAANPRFWAAFVLLGE